MKADLVEYLKQEFEDYVLEIKIWRLKDKRYPLGIKYSLIFVNFRTGKKS